VQHLCKKHSKCNVIVYQMQWIRYYNDKDIRNDNKGI
jgi:hypothetical protein